MNERIVHAAIRHEGEVYFLPRPARHGDIFKANSVSQNGVIVSSIAAGEQGFVTNSGRFVDRYEAKEIAAKASQLLPPASPMTNGEMKLYTEDLW